MNYESDLKIDESALDVEWLEQPRLMFKYAKLAAQARLERDQRKEHLDLVRAELDKEIRMDPERFEILKSTEGAIQSAIISHGAFQKANNAFLESRFEAEVISGALSAVESRKNALENLVRLHGLQYFAGPSIPRDLSKEWEKQERQKNSNVKVSEAMMRRIKK